MKPRWPTIFCVVAALSGIAAADDPPTHTAVIARCEQGLAFAAKNDLPRAALYLENCRDLDVDADRAAKFSRTRNDVAHKLDNSKLSAMTIVTTPEGLLAETDAMPGERFTTPATIWAKAGDYKVHVAADAATLDAGQGLTTDKTLEKFSRSTVIINAPQKKQTAPKDGKADFSDEAEETGGHTGPPPQQKWGSILPDKYRKKKPGSGGPLLEDPLAYHVDESQLAWRLGARIGGGVFFEDTSNASSTFSVAALAGRPITGPLSFASRLGWTHRAIDSVALELGASLRLASTPSLVLSTTLALRGDVRVQDELAMQPVARIGVGAAAGLDLALLSLPVAIGLRVEPSFTELTPGTRAHAMVLELGYDWR